jgi:tetratricopeptide (TPR) repeat protein
MTMIDNDHLTLVRPQPLGLFDGPAGLLLIGSDGDTAPVVDALARGAAPETWPGSSAAFKAACSGDYRTAVNLLGDDRISAVNRLVLEPSDDHLTQARRASTGDPRMEAVVAAAAYASGLSDAPPSPEGLDGEFAVLALTVRAARALEFKDSRGALRLLRQAVPFAAQVGPALHARVLGMLAEHQFNSHGANEAVLDLYDQAIDLLTPTDRDELRAGMHLQRGLVAHQMADGQRHRLVEAVRSYQSALIVLSEQSSPEAFALANMNIAVAILSMPMTQASDQVRLGVAVQSLRAALRVYRPETHPNEWSSCQMNLANALQYLPSSHLEENLREAVELYEVVLGRRSVRSDPMGYARVLANQANALAHLGSFEQAEERYARASDLFGKSGDVEAVEVVQRQLAEIETQRAKVGNGSEGVAR